MDQRFLTKNLFNLRKRLKKIDRVQSLINRFCNIFCNIFCSINHQAIQIRRIIRNNNYFSDILQNRNATVRLTLSIAPYLYVSPYFHTSFTSTYSNLINFSCNKKKKKMKHDWKKRRIGLDKSKVRSANNKAVEPPLSSIPRSGAPSFVTEIYFPIPIGIWPRYRCVSTRN